MKLKFCANLSFMFQESASLAGRYHLARKNGFNAVEGGYPYQENTLDDSVQAKKDAKLEHILLNMFVGGPTGKGCAAIPGEELQFQESLALSVKHAKALQCSKIHIMSGVVEQATEQHYEVYEKNIRFAASLLERENMIALIEPINGYSVPFYFMNSYDRAVALVRSINSPSLKLMLDIFHLQHLKGNLTHNIKDLLPVVGHIQIAQVPSRNEPDTPGEINFPYVFSVLEEQGYDGYIGLEYIPLTTTEEGLKWISKLGVQL